MTCPIVVWIVSFLVVKRDIHVSRQWLSFSSQRDSFQFITQLYVSVDVMQWLSLQWHATTCNTQCDMRQHGATCNNMRQHATTCNNRNNMRQHATKWNNMRQHATTGNNMQQQEQHATIRNQRVIISDNMRHYAMTCDNEKQHAITCNNNWQHARISTTCNNNNSFL